MLFRSVADSEYQLGEDRGLAVFAQTGDAVLQDRLLDHTGLPAGAQTEAEGDKRRLAVGGMQGVYLILQRLECVITLFLGTGMGVAFYIWDVPLLGDLAVLLEAGRDERSQHFIDAVNGGAAIDMASHLRDDLSGDCGGGRDGFGLLDLRIPHLESIGQHPLQIDQHAVEHREEGRVVEIVVVDLATLMRLYHVAWQ